MHDWSLQRIEIDWSQGRLQVFLTGENRNYVLLAENIKYFEFSMDENWGSSNSILESSGIANFSNGSAISIVIQSGDFMRIEAEQLTLSSLPTLNSSDNRLNDFSFGLIYDFNSKKLNLFGSLKIDLPCITRLYLTRNQFVKKSNEVEETEEIQFNNEKQL